MCMYCTSSRAWVVCRKRDGQYFWHVFTPHATERFGLWVESMWGLLRLTFPPSHPPTGRMRQPTMLSCRYRVMQLWCNMARYMYLYLSLKFFNRLEALKQRMESVCIWLGLSAAGSHARCCFDAWWPCWGPGTIESRYGDTLESFIRLCLWYYLLYFCLISNGV